MVFGKNVITHPELCPMAPSTLESRIDVSKKIASHLNALSKAREAFIQAESDKTISEALKSRIVNRVEEIDIGSWIYYKNLESKQWQGPSKVIMLDNKNVFTLRNNKLVSINKDHVVLKRSERDDDEPYLTLPPIPKENENNSAEELHEELGRANNEQPDVGTRRPHYEENTNDRHAPVNEEKEASEEEPLHDNMGYDNPVIELDHVDTNQDHAVQPETLEEPGTPSEVEVADERITIEEAAEVRAEVDDTKGKQKKEGQFKVACNICDK